MNNVGLATKCYEHVAWLWNEFLIPWPFPAICLKCAVPIQHSQCVHRAMFSAVLDH